MLEFPVRVSTSEEEIARQKIDTDDFENREIIAKKMTVSIDTKHAVYSNGEEQDSQVPITFFAESTTSRASVIPQDTELPLGVFPFSYYVLLSKEQ